jgi:hypothetical protein
MAIRITKSVQEHQIVLKVDGWLKADDVEELSRACQSVQQAMALDLSELQSADHDGVRTLRELVSLGVEVHGASPYIELLLKTKS